MKTNFILIIALTIIAGIVIFAGAMIYIQPPTTEPTTVAEENLLKAPESEENKNLTEYSFVGKEIAVLLYNEPGDYGISSNSSWIVGRKSDSEAWEKVLKISDGRVIDDITIVGTNLYLKVYDGKPYLKKFDLKTKELESIPTDGLLVNLMKVEDELLLYVLDSPGHCYDSPTTIGKCNASIYTLDLMGDFALSLPENFRNLPGSKGLVAYDPDKNTLILRDGYADGACRSTSVYTYDLKNQKMEKVFIGGACAEEIDAFEKKLDDFYKLIKETYTYTINSSPTDIILFDGNRIVNLNRTLNTEHKEDILISPITLSIMP